MANYSLQCNDPEAAIAEIASLMNAVSEVPTHVAKFNTELGQHVGNVGQANGELVEQLIAVGGPAIVAAANAMNAELMTSLLYPAFDSYIAMHGTKHEKDNRNLDI